MGLGDILGIGVGDVFSAPYEAQVQGYLNQELAPGKRGGGNPFNGIKLDPATLAAQNNALQGLISRSQTGYDLGDRANIQGALSDVAQQNAGNMGAIQQRMAAQGQANSGNALAAQLANAQGQAGRANQAGTNVAIQGRQRALQALQDSAGLAGQMRQQQYGQLSDAARAQMDINARNQDMRMRALQNAMNYYSGQASNARQQGQQVGQDLDQTAQSAASAIGSFGGG